MKKRICAFIAGCLLSSLSLFALNTGAGTFTESDGEPLSTALTLGATVASTSYSIGAIFSDQTSLPPTFDASSFSDTQSVTGTWDLRSASTLSDDSTTSGYIYLVLLEGNQPDATTLTVTVADTGFINDSDTSYSNTDESAIGAFEYPGESGSSWTVSLPILSVATTGTDSDHEKSIQVQAVGLVSSPVAFARFNITWDANTALSTGEYTDVVTVTLATS